MSTSALTRTISRRDALERERRYHEVRKERTATRTRETEQVDAWTNANATDAAKRLGRERGVDPSSVTGSGEDGRIVANDIPAEA